MFHVFWEPYRKQSVFEVQINMVISEQYWCLFWCNDIIMPLLSWRKTLLSTHDLITSTKSFQFMIVCSFFYFDEVEDFMIVKSGEEKKSIETWMETRVGCCEAGDGAQLSPTTIAILVCFSSSFSVWCWGLLFVWIIVYYCDEDEEEEYPACLIVHVIIRFPWCCLPLPFPSDAWLVPDFKWTKTEYLKQVEKVESIHIRFKDKTTSH